MRKKDVDTMRIIKGRVRAGSEKEDELDNTNEIGNSVLISAERCWGGRTTPGLQFHQPLRAVISKI